MLEEPDASRLAKLIVQWYALVGDGESPTPEQLCPGNPDLLRQLRAYLAAQTLSADAETCTAADSDALEFSVGRYRLRRIIGCGGFGQVWQAYDPELQRLVAVKIARPDRVASPDSREQFVREARRLAQLGQQQGIVPVYDVGRAGELCFIVSELMSGGSLAERAAAGSTLSFTETAQVIADVAEALHQSHLTGVVHRDVKPGNILFDGNGRAHLADFGLATSEEEQLAEHRGVLGTWSYMSPEQVRGESHLVDGRTDVYSLGVVLYQMLTGRLPYVAPTRSDYLRQVVERDPRPPRSVDDEIPTELERICLKCLARPIADRYTTAADLATDLRQWIEAQQTTRKSWRLTPWIGSAALAMLVAGAVGLAVLGWHWSRPSTTRMWQDLGKATPMPVLVADGAQWSPSADRRELRIDSPEDFTFLSLGSAPAPRWRIECDVAGEPPDGADKVFGAGVFFGLRTERGPAGEPRPRMQAVFIVRDRSGAGYHMHRRMIELRSRPDGSVYPFLYPPAEANHIDDKPVGDLALETGPTGLEIVTWRRQAARRLVMPDVNDRASRDDYVGEFGVFVFGGAATFGNLRFKQLGDD